VEVATVLGSQLEGCRYRFACIQYFSLLSDLHSLQLLPLTASRHPLFERESPLVIGGDYITTETGTGLVHTAPGHGQEDYLVGQRYGLELLSPVDDAGNFTDEAGEKFKGLNVQVRVITMILLY
jgi:isoleucyl-tRNA synthetase